MGTQGNTHVAPGYVYRAAANEMLIRDLGPVHKQSQAT